MPAMRVLIVTELSITRVLRRGTFPHAFQFTTAFPLRLTTLKREREALRHPSLQGMASFYRIFQHE